jgi:peptidylamidoglycolate lyase
MYYEPGNGAGLPVLGEEDLVQQPEQNFADLADSEDESTFFELSPTIGQTAGLAVDSNSNLVLFHRSGRVWDEYSFAKDNRLNKSLGAIPNATIAVIDPNSGKMISEHGQNLFYMPHGLSIDSDGNYWLTDVGSHQVTKLDKAFKPVMTLGEKLVPGSDEKHFCKPTDVAVAKNGDFFVADGYCNSRVMKFNKDGKLLATFGSPNSGYPPNAGEFLVPHSLALIEDLNLLCVADRENQRIQCFAAGLTEGQHFHPRAFVPTGTFFTKAENIGRVFAIREKQHYLVGVTDHDEIGQVQPQIFVMDMNTGMANTFAKGLENAHALAINDFGDIFVSQINPNQIIKFSVPNEI